MMTIVVKTGPRTWRVAYFKGPVSMYTTDPKLYHLGSKKYHDVHVAAMAAGTEDDNIKRIQRGEVVRTDGKE